MVVQEIESTELGQVLEKVKSAKALGLPFTLTAEVQTKTLGKHQYHSLLYTLCIETAPRGTLMLSMSGSWLIKE